MIAEDSIASHGFWAGNNEGPIGSREVVTVDHPDFDEAIRVSITNPDGAFYNGQVSFASTRAVETGEVILIRVFFRSISSEDETGTSFTTVYPQSPGPAYTKYLIREITAFKEDGWKEFLLPFVMTEPLAAGDLTLLFGLGGGNHPQVWEIGGIEMVSYGTGLSVDDLPQTKPSYLGRDPDAAWRPAAAKRIETYRKGPIRIHVFDAAGNPVQGAKVQLNFKKHAYHFGSAVAAWRLLDESPENLIYRQKILELFNEAGPFNAFKWPAWAGDWGSTNFGPDVALGAAQWMKANNLYARAHVMVWPSERHLPNSIKALIPDDNPAATDPSVKQLVLDHIAEIGAASAPYIDEWDVVNEPFDNHDLMDAFGKEVMVEWFNQARSVLPTQGLFLNDYSILSGGGRNVEHQQHYEDTIRYLLENHAPITALGMQGHFNNSPTGIDVLWQVLERYANAFPGLPIRITEFTVETDDEEMQADFLRDFFTLVFSHPQTIGIQHWGFWEGQTESNAALFRTNWETKPNGQAYMNLVFGDWWNNFEGETDALGTFSRRGFFGDYEIKINLEGVETTRKLAFPVGSSGEMSVLLDNEQSVVPALTNGNFEIGDLTGWTVTTSATFENPPTIYLSGTDNPYFTSKARVGSMAMGFGLKGTETGSITLEQTIEVPDQPEISLAVDANIAWNLATRLNGITLLLHIEDEDGNPAADPVTIFEPSESAGPEITSYRRTRVDLTSFRGQTLRIRFTMANDEISEGSFTFVLLDNITMAPYRGPSMNLELGDKHSIRLTVMAFDDSKYVVEKSTNLTDWSAVAELSNLDLGSPVITEEPIPETVSEFYRMREK
ncbi:MAG: endo-1,4-beta-xylanase [Verrucomicrobiae bacterium]|nr:endo-1,4-beta-xylanase [Verrucomicrobiae bacterium]